MTQRFDLCTPRRRNDGKTFWVRIGTMFPSDKGGFNMYFDALPLPDAEGKCMVAAFEPREKGQRDSGDRGGYGGGKPSGGAPDPMDGDSIPFNPEVR